MKRLKTMLHVDFRRMFTMPLLYIMVGICLVMPVLILVMTTMMDGSVSVDPTTGVETVIEGFDSVWQIIGSVSTAESTGGMDMVSMCNINLLYFAVAVLGCIFVCGDFTSGYAKNLFAVRSKKGDYVLSKTIVCFAGGALMVLAFFAGSLLGGAIAGLPFEMVGFGAGNLVMCLLSKIFLMLLFVAIAVLASVIGKQKLWVGLVGSCMVGMLFFMMIPMLTPLDSTVMNVFLCLAGGTVFSVVLGLVSKTVLNKTSLV